MGNTKNKRKIDKENCMLYGTPHCRLLNMQSCKDCYIAKLSKEEQRSAMEDIATVAAAMPYGGMEAISEGEKCALCKRGRISKPDGGYARFCLGHLNPNAPDEENSKGHKRSTALVVPVQLPVCRSCRANITKLNFIPLLVGMLVAIIGVAAVSFTPLKATLEKSGRIIPFLISLISIFVGIIVGSLVRGFIIGRISSQTTLTPNHIPGIKELIEDGWFVISNSELSIPFTFSEAKMAQDIMTCENQEETISEIIKWGEENSSEE